MAKESFADKIMRETMNRVLSGGIDEDVAYDTIQAIQLALKAQAEALQKGAERVNRGDVRCPQCLQPVPPNARDIAHLSKALDECARLLQFAKGGPDHRTALVGGTSDERAILGWLTDTQMAQVSAWVEENMAAAGSRA